MQTTSITLLSRLRQANDFDAWRRFVRIYSPILYGWARKMRVNHTDALDLVQDVFASLVKHLPEFEYDSHKYFRGWLWIVTRRRWLETCRRTNVSVQSNCDMDQFPEESEAGRSLEEADFQAYVFTSIVRNHRGQFAESTWRAFWKFAVERRPVAEVAAEEGISVASVYKAKLRVTAHLKAVFEENKIDD
ncbi:MAG: sigma-70 family RNA polymerase sigma factor [Gemmataceae bacterium]